MLQVEQQKMPSSTSIARQGAATTAKMTLSRQLEHGNLAESALA